MMRGERMCKDIWLLGWEGENDLIFWVSHAVRCQHLHRDKGYNGISSDDVKAFSNGDDRERGWLEPF